MHVQTQEQDNWRKRGTKKQNSQQGFEKNENACSVEGVFKFCIPLAPFQH